MDTWWIDKPHLVGSSNPSDADLQQLRENGFGVIVSLLDEKEQTPDYDTIAAKAMGYVRYNIPVQDFTPPSVEQLEQFISLINEQHPSTKTIVHCAGGLGRTGTFAAAYWITQGMTTAKAITHIRKARPHAVETPEQEAVLLEYENKMRANTDKALHTSTTYVSHRSIAFYVVFFLVMGVCVYLLLKMLHFFGWV